MQLIVKLDHDNIYPGTDAIRSLEQMMVILTM
jgi:hypothetical protein